MVIRDLELENYRNFDSLKVNFSSGLNIIIGNNGIGKTSIIESIYMLCFTKSFCTCSNNFIIKDNCEYTKIRGSFIEESNNNELCLEYLLSKLGKNLKINGIQKKKLVNIFLL